MSIIYSRGTTINEGFTMLELMNVSWDLVIAIVILGLIALAADIIIDISKR
jgi:hypothetical protein